MQRYAKIQGKITLEFEFKPFWIKWDDDEIEEYIKENYGDMIDWDKEIYVGCDYTVLDDKVEYDEYDDLTPYDDIADELEEIRREN